MSGVHCQCNSWPLCPILLLGVGGFSPVVDYVEQCCPTEFCSVQLFASLLSTSALLWELGLSNNMEYIYGWVVLPYRDKILKYTLKTYNPQLQHLV